MAEKASKQPYAGRVRVRLPNGAESTVGAAYATRHNLTVLDKDAVDSSGRALPAKPKTDKGTTAASASDDTAKTNPKTTTAKEA